MNSSEVVLGYMRFLEKDVFKVKAAIIVFVLSTLVSLIVLMKSGFSYVFYIALLVPFIYIIMVLYKKLVLVSNKYSETDYELIEKRIADNLCLLNKSVVESESDVVISRDDCIDIEIIIDDGFNEVDYISKDGSYVRPHRSIAYLKKRLGLAYFLNPLAYLLLVSMNIVYNAFALTYLLVAL